MERILKIRATCRGFERHIRRACKRLKRPKVQYLEDNPLVAHAYFACMDKLNHAKRDWAYKLVGDESLAITEKLALSLLQAETESQQRIRAEEDRLQHYAATVKSENESFRLRTIEDSQKLKASIKKDKERLNLKIEDLERENAKLRLASLEAEASRSKSAKQAVVIENLRQKVGGLHDVLNGKEKEVADLHNVVDNLSLGRAKLVKENKSLLAQITEQKAHIDSAPSQDDLVRCHDRLSRRDTQISKYHKQRKLLHAALVSVHKNLVNTKRYMEEQKVDSVVPLRGIVASLQVQLASLLEARLPKKEVPLLIRELKQGFALTKLGDYETTDSLYRTLINFLEVDAQEILGIKTLLDSIDPDNPVGEDPEVAGHDQWS